MINDDITVLELSQFSDRSEFIELVKTELTQTFKCTVDSLPTNYGYKEKWSLLSLLESNDVDYYGLIYVNGIFWSASGGKLRPGNIYQACFRMFADTRRALPSFGYRYYEIKHNLTNQIERAKINNAEWLIISFNEHNLVLYELLKRKFIPAVFGSNHQFIFVDVPEKFNAVPQYLIKLDLRQS